MCLASDASPYTVFYDVWLSDASFRCFPAVLTVSRGGSPENCQLSLFSKVVNFQRGITEMKKFQETFFFIVVRTLNMRFKLLTNHRVHSTVLLFIGPLLYSKSPELTLWSKNLYPMTDNSQFLPPPAPAAKRMNLEDILLSEIKQTLKDKYWVIPLTWGI